MLPLAVPALIDMFGLEWMFRILDILIAVTSIQCAQVVTKRVSTCPLPHLDYDWGYWCLHAPFANIIFAYFRGLEWGLAVTGAGLVGRINVSTAVGCILDDGHAMKLALPTP